MAPPSPHRRDPNYRAALRDIMPPPGGAAAPSGPPVQDRNPVGPPPAATNGRASKADDADLERGGDDTADQPRSGEELLSDEGAILAQLLRAADHKTKIKERVEVRRDKRLADGTIVRGPDKKPVKETLLSFDIEVIDQAEIQQAALDNTYFKRKNGRREVERTDESGYYALVIYKATVKNLPGGRCLWDIEDGWRHLGVTGPEEFIDTVLLAGEKQMIFDRIAEISGYSAAEDDELKN